MKKDRKRGLFAVLFYDFEKVPDCRNLLIVKG